MTALSIRGMHDTEREQERLADIESRRHVKALTAGRYWKQRESFAMEALRIVDPNWEEWFDNDNNVPALGTSRQRTLLIEKRIKARGGAYRVNAILYRGVFIWSDPLKTGFTFEDEDGGLFNYPSMYEAKFMIDAACRIATRNYRDGAHGFAGRITSLAACRSRITMELLEDRLKADREAEADRRAEADTCRNTQ